MKFKVGDKVRNKVTNMEGEITKIEKDKAWVASYPRCFWNKLEKLELIEEPQDPKTAKNCNFCEKEMKVFLNLYYTNEAFMETNTKHEGSAPKMMCCHNPSCKAMGLIKIL